MRRIVHYYPGAMGNSGVTFALWSWARAQAASGAEVCVLHARDASSTTAAGCRPQDHGPGLTARCIPHAGRNRLTWPTDLNRHLGRNDLLVLHEGWVVSNLVAAHAASRAGVPYVVMPHGVYERAWTSYLKPPRWVRDRLERRLLERAAAVHLFFESEIPDVAARAPVSAFLTVPTGFDIPAERWTGGGGYLGWIGRIDPIHKGLDLLVRAMARLAPAERPDLRIHGYDYEGGMSRLRRLVDTLGLNAWVRVEGPITGAEKARFMRQADGYIHPSRWECHSIALLEHLALGAPCLVSNTIHIAPTLRQSSAAVLATPSEADLADALRRWAGDRLRIAARGRELVGSAFNWSRLMPQFHSALGRLGLQ